MSSSDSQIVLASASPRRLELLAQIGLDVHVVPSHIDEDAVVNESPEDHVIRLSCLKAHKVAGRLSVPGRWFIGSDTIVLKNQTILGKPRNATEANKMLKSLSGQTHQVISGFAVHDRVSGKTISGAVTTKVFFKKLTSAEIEGYIATGEPFDKAGSYAIQGIGSFMIPKIEGSYTNVVGLPLCEVISALEELEAIELFPE